jgi:hypothetical protein
LRFEAQRFGAPGLLLLAQPNVAKKMMGETNQTDALGAKGS